MTGLVLVTTIMRDNGIDMSTIENGGQMTTAAFSQIPVLGPIILVIGIICFAYSTILGWSYYGERCAEYLFGKKALLPYKAALHRSYRHRSRCCSGSGLEHR